MSEKKTQISAPANQMKICMVASGGGHLRQLMQLTPIIEQYNCFFVTEPTALGKTISEEQRVRFVPHFAFGQRRLDGFLSFLWSGIKNSFASGRIFLMERPNVIISTGAGAAFVTLFLGWLFRRKIVYIESIARVNQVSLFGRLASRFAGLYLIQWPYLQAILPEARFCDPLSISDCEETKTANQTFVTIGTIVPFDRLISAVVDLKERGVLTGRIIAQIGDSDQAFNGIETFASCSYTDMNRYMDESDLVICHGGSGSMLGALKAGCRVVAMARKPELGEHYDAHQIELTSALEKKGVLSVAQDENDLERAVAEARSRPRQRVEYDPTALVAEIKAFIG